MATITTFYVKTPDTNGVTETLKSLTKLSDTTSSPFHEKISYDLNKSETALPDYLVVGNTQSDWVTVIHNSFSKLQDWGEILSNEFDTKVIMTMAQSVSSVYYFALYDKGQKVREIETCYSTDFDMVNYGTKFDFENDQPGSKVNYGDGDEYIFDFDNIDEYCKQFGLTVRSDYDHMTWTILSDSGKQKTRLNSSKESGQRKKPWWKIW